ncbi:YfjI family protein [Roseateles sp. BYS96W]|uniref:YfjI family protein n=1 Tax=Pelomonas nitida TaxID=3299027 RepID=A0ABW7G1Q8_9BURK
MMYFNNPGNYPVYCFPAGIRQAILAMHAQTKAPLEIVGASVLAVLATATQHIARVQRPSGQIAPLSLALLTLAASGDRKTSSDDVAFVAIRAFEKAQADQRRSALERHEAELMAWKAQRDGVALQIKQYTAKGEPTEPLVSQLKELQSKKPTHPQVVKLVYADTTPEALSVGLHKNSASAALLSNEASRLLFGPAMSNLSMLSELWSGSSVPIDRVSAESFVLEALLTSSLMLQPSEFNRFQKTRGEHMRGSGYLARCLVSRPLSIQGFREIFPGEIIAVDDTERFHDRITELLRTNNTRPTGNVIGFNQHAACSWTAFFNETESQQKQGWFYADIADFASKIADNAARIAAIFSIYEGITDFIDQTSIHQAVEISKWYLAQFKMIFGTQFKLPEEQQDAMMLEQWVNRVPRAMDGFIYIDRSKIMQFGPNPLRNREKLNRALGWLEFHGRATQWRHGRKTVVKFTPWA